MARYLVTGGAGFVGSHVAAALHKRGDEVVVVDNLSQGHRAAVPPQAELIVADLLAPGLLDSVLGRSRWDGVLHFAALSLVGDSMQRPLHYLLENGSAGLHLIAACIRNAVPRFVLSSTANLFGAPDIIPIGETAAMAPSSPYGESKLILERALRWADQLHGFRSACLRYFNAAGADENGQLGEDHTPETHLIPLVIDAALGRRDEISVFGTDYATQDGTCIRDYVHVSDLAQAHLLALDQLHDRSVTYNLGNGRGFSVREVIEAVELVSGRKVPVREAPRRAGDPPVLVAASDLIRRDTGWTPRFTELTEIVRTAYEWRRDHPHGYGSLAPKLVAEQHSGLAVVSSAAA